MSIEHLHAGGIFMEREKKSQNEAQKHNVVWPKTQVEKYSNFFLSSQFHVAIKIF